MGLFCTRPVATCNSTSDFMTGIVVEMAPERKQPLARGTFSKIARRLGVSPQAVRLVYIGHATSKRIASELRREARKQGVAA